MERLNFCTPVDTSSSGFRLKPDDTCLLLGSCFTENIGNRLVDNKFNVVVNPFGVLYNPQSIFTALSLLLQNASRFCPFEEKDLFFSDNLWHSWFFSSAFSAPKLSECLSLVNGSLECAAQMLKKLDVLFLTFGTNHCYFLKDSHMSVANCHKQPAALFDERILSVSEIVSLSSVLDGLLRLRPSLKIVFTVSPYRYTKYGLHESQLGKAVLLLAVEEIRKRYSANCFYFPAYEIMNDELRDYRFYADDFLHTSSMATDYIWNIFVDEWMSPEAISFVHEWQTILAAFKHRPFNIQTDAYRKFLTKLAERIKTLRQKYPNFVFNKDLAEVESRLHESNG